MPVLKVSAQSNPKAVAGAIASIIREQGWAEIQAVGAGAVNQTMKSIAIARGYLVPGGVNLVTIPSFIEIDIDGLMKTALHFRVEPR